jgi:hypothetical protein
MPVLSRILLSTAVAVLGYVPQQPLLMRLVLKHLENQQRIYLASQPLFLRQHRRWLYLFHRHLPQLGHVLTLLQPGIRIHHLSRHPI